MNQYLLRFSLPQGICMYPNVFREALAKTNLLPAAFFGYDPETSHPIRQCSSSSGCSATAAQLANPLAIPSIRIVGARSWVGVLATGDSAKELLDAAVVPGIQVVSAHCGAAVPVNVERHSFSMSGRDAPVEYWVREMVIKKGLCKQSGLEIQISVVKSRIERALLAQAAKEGLDCPPESLMDIRVAEIVRSRGLKIVGSTGETKQFAALLDVRFYANLQLSGFWFAGNLTARGYGRIGQGVYSGNWGGK